MSNHPLAEVFGFPIANTTAQAKHYREKRLCPYNNKVPSCTKDKARNPLGVCSVYDDCGPSLMNDWKPGMPRVRRHWRTS